MLKTATFDAVEDAIAVLSRNKSVKTGVADQKLRSATEEKLHQEEEAMIQQMRTLLQAEKWQAVVTRYERLDWHFKKNWDLSALTLVAMRHLGQPEVQKKMADSILQRLLRTVGPIKTRTGVKRFAFQVAMVFEEAGDVVSLEQLLDLAKKKGILTIDIERMLLNAKAQLAPHEFGKVFMEKAQADPSLLLQDEPTADAIKRAIQVKDHVLARFVIDQLEAHNIVPGPQTLASALFACSKRLINPSWGTQQLIKRLPTLELTENDHLLALAIISFFQLNPSSELDPQEAFSLWTRFRNVIHAKPLNPKDHRMLGDTFGALIALAHSVPHYELAFLFYYDSLNFIPLSDEVLDSLLSPHNVSGFSSPISAYFAQHVLQDTVVPLTEPPRNLPQLDTSKLSPRALVTIIRALAASLEWKAVQHLLPLHRQMLHELNIQPAYANRVLAALIANLPANMSEYDQRGAAAAKQIRHQISTLPPTQAISPELRTHFQTLLEYFMPQLAIDPPAPPQTPSSSE